ncbi:EAL domain-containing protein [Bacillus subtilis]
MSIDDFGTGFSAFVYLKHYPIHEIKLDRQSTKPLPAAWMNYRSSLIP